MAKRDSKRLFTDEQLKELHRQGLNDREIGEKLGADASTVGYHRRKLKLARAHPLKYMDEKIKPLYNFLNYLPGVRTTGSCQGHPDSKNFKNAYIKFICSNLRTLGMLASITMRPRYKWDPDKNKTIVSWRGEIHLNALWNICIVYASEMPLSGYYMEYCLSPDPNSYSDHNEVYEDLEELLKYYEIKWKREQQNLEHLRELGFKR